MSVPRLQALHLPRLWNRAEDLNSPEPESGKGFDNPMFDMVSGPAGGMGCSVGVFFPSPPIASLSLPQELPGAGSVEETLQEMASEGHQVFYINPLYDPSETET